MWNTVLFPSLGISIYETLSWCLHSTYRYMKLCVDSFIQHIDIRKSVLNTSGNIALFDTYSEAFQQLCHVWNILNPSATISLYVTCYELFRQPSFKSHHDNLVPHYVQFKVFKTSSIARHAGSQKTSLREALIGIKCISLAFTWSTHPFWVNLLERQTVLNVCY